VSLQERALDDCRVGVSTDVYRIQLQQSVIFKFKAVDIAIPAHALIEVCDGDDVQFPCKLCLFLLRNPQISPEHFFFFTALLHGQNAQYKLQTSFADFLNENLVSCMQCP
jgi:hypothetical protein